MALFTRSHEPVNGVLVACEGECVMKQLGNKKLLVLIAGALAVLAFIFSFIAPLKAEMTVMGTTISENASFSDAFFGDGEAYNGAILSFIGFVLILAAGIYLIISNFKEIKADKTLKLVAIALLVVGAILVFLTETFYIGSMIVPEGIPAEAVTQAKESAAEMLKLGFGTLFGGILAILSAACVAVSQFVVKD